MESKHSILIETNSSKAKINDKEISIANILIATLEWNNITNIKNYYTNTEKINLNKDTTSIFIKEWDHIEELKLPKYLKKRFIKYLSWEKNIVKRIENNLDYIDCVDFSNYLIWIPNIKNLWWKLYDLDFIYDNSKRYWKNFNTPISINFIKNIKKEPWEAFILVNRENKSNHEIVYLWNELYVSKFWWFDIFITNIEEILKRYPSNLIARKKKFWIEWIIKNPTSPTH